MPHVPHGRRRFPAEILTNAEDCRLLEACGCRPAGLRNRALIAVLYRGGLRINADLDQVVLNLGPCDGCPEDINRDGVVNGQDAAAVATHFGPCP